MPQKAQPRSGVRWCEAGVADAQRQQEEPEQVAGGQAGHRGIVDLIQQRRLDPHAIGGGQIEILLLLRAPLLRGRQELMLQPREAVVEIFRYVRDPSDPWVETI